MAEIEEKSYIALMHVLLRCPGPGCDWIYDQRPFTGQVIFCENPGCKLYLKKFKKPIFEVKLEEFIEEK